ncbi:50S rRNA methyltransferase [Paenibacillus thalictri]|uniref:50S rRNA methyltransferase n=1 Tax=Paenibacillus thalictri TaxID=2527873 RepID=A0A4V2J3R7_9BACL|nr:50S rRNA methyltransferase [Paenibacillus thalictri]
MAKFDIYVIQTKLEKFYLDAIKEYEKRLTRYGKTQLLMLKNREQLSAKLADSSFTVLVTPTKPTISSESFADKINSWGVSGSSQVAFIIGSDLPQADERLSLSQMDRAYRIIHNHPYHK